MTASTTNGTIGSPALVTGGEGSVISDPTLVSAIVVLMLVAGLVGGLASFLSESESDDREKPRLRLSRFLLGGIVAAACVPLFLSLVRSGLITDILQNRNGTRVESLLIFSGLCLVAGYYSRRFLDTVSRRVLQQAERAEQKAEAATETAREAIELADEQSAVPGEPGKDAIPDLQLIDLDNLPSVSEDELRALRAMTKMSFRTATGIAGDSGLSRSKISELLDNLERQKLALLTQSPNTKGPRWKITPLGIAVVRQHSDGN